PPLAELQEGFKKLKEYQTLSQKVLKQIRGELEQWKKQSAESQESKEQAAAIRNFQERVEKEISDRFQGKIKEIMPDEKEYVLTDKAGKDWHFKVEETAQIQRNDKEVKFEDLKENDEVIIRLSNLPYELESLDKDIEKKHATLQESNRDQKWKE